MRRGRSRTSAFTAAAAFAAAITLALAPLAGSASTYTDPAGDSGDGPDLTLTRVSNDAAGEITFQISIGNRPSGISNREFLILFADADRNAQTGSSGFDYRVRFFATEYDLARWNGTTFEKYDPPTDRAEVVAGGFVFRINRTDLGNTTGFNFGIASFAASQRVADISPDTGLLAYTLVRYCKVPNVLGKTLTSAKATITKAACAVGKVTKKKSKAKKNRVIGQSPGAGGTVVAGTKVNLVVSRGRK